MPETHVAHTKPLQSLSEPRGKSKVRKPIFSNSGKRYLECKYATTGLIRNSLYVSKGDSPL